MKTLLFTLDYELYGNGSGNVFQHIIEPTNKILEIAEKYNAKLTFFFEVVEYWRLKEEWEKGNLMGYSANPIEAMELQLQYAYHKGHDIQLHIHPQWVNAYYTNDGWKVNTAEWRLGDYSQGGNMSLTNLLQKGKETIEQIINDKNYHCTTLRAGGYNAQPSKRLVTAMKEVGLLIDSSIYPGGKETGSLSQYDYTNISTELGMWYCENDLETPINKISNLIELPIVAFPILRLYKYLSLDRIKSLLRNRQSAKDTFEAKTNHGKGSIKEKIQFFFQYEAQTWDYCLFSKALHKYFLRTIEKQIDRNVFVLVGHPKSFVSGKGLEYLLNKTYKHYSLNTISDYIKSI